jgi:hypothetical protein
MKIHTNEIPFGHRTYREMVTLVVDLSVRPERPDEAEAPQLTDDTWQLAERCWVKEPRARPTIDQVRKTAGLLLQAYRPLEEREMKRENETTEWAGDSDRTDERFGQLDGADPGRYSPLSILRYDDRDRGYSKGSSPQTPPPQSVGKNTASVSKSASTHRSGVELCNASTSWPDNPLTSFAEGTSSGLNIPRVI